MESNLCGIPPHPDGKKFVMSRAEGVKTVNPELDDLPRALRDILAAIKAYRDGGGLWPEAALDAVICTWPTQDLMKFLMVLERHVATPRTCRKLRRWGAVLAREGE